MAPVIRNTRLLWLIIAIALLMRLLYAMSQPTLAEYGSVNGGDSGWYLAIGAGFFRDQVHGTVRGVTFYNSVIPTPPLYVLFVGLIQQLLPDHEAIVAMRLFQCLAASATVFLAYRIAAAIGRDQRAGLFTACLLAFHPALIIEPANIASETLYIFFLTLGLWLYIENFVVPTHDDGSAGIAPQAAVVLAALALGLATLTRAVSVLFPVMLAGHLLWMRRPTQGAATRKLALLLLLTYGALLSTWTIYNLALWNRLVIVSDQLMPAIWRGVETDDGSPAQNDALLLAGEAPQVADGCEIDCKYQHPTALYLRRIAAIAQADFAGLIARRASELGYALLQPHGTTSLGDVSITAAARDWLADDRSGAGVAAILEIEGFAIKLVTWAFHYTALLMGILGIVLARRQIMQTAPLWGFAAYTMAAHLILLALPRYLFPLEFIWAIFAGIAAMNLARRFRGRGPLTGVTSYDY